MHAGNSETCLSTYTLESGYYHCLTHSSVTGSKLLSKTTTKLYFSVAYQQLLPILFLMLFFSADPPRASRISGKLQKTFALHSNTICIYTLAPGSDILDTPPSWCPCSHKTQLPGGSRHVNATGDICTCDWAKGSAITPHVASIKVLLTEFGCLRGKGMLLKSVAQCTINLLLHHKPIPKNAQ